MKITTHRTRVFIVNRDNKFLAMVRKFKDKNGIISRVILLPGGGVDEGENSKQSLIREVEEELGLTLPDPQFIYEYKNTRAVTSNEQVIWPGATQITNRFDFYITRLTRAVKPIMMEPEKFDEIAWVNSKTIAELNKRYRASIGDGIEETLAYVKETGVSLESQDLLPIAPTYYRW